MPEPGLLDILLVFGGLAIGALFVTFLVVSIVRGIRGTPRPERRDPSMDDPRLKVANRQNDEAAMQQVFRDLDRR